MPKYSKEGFKPNAKVQAYTCKQCAQSFYSNRPEVEFCSSTCRNYNWRNRKGLSPSSKKKLKGTSLLTPVEIDKLIEGVDSLMKLTPFSPPQASSNLETHPGQSGPTVISILDLALQLETEIKELQELKQLLQGNIEGEFYEQMRYQGGNTISTNILPVLHYMEKKHELLLAFAWQLRQTGVYLQVHPLQT